MSSHLDYRLEQFQSKLQQHLNINDDEIARLADYLNSVNSEIVDYKDKLNRFRLQSDQALQDSLGRRKRQKAQLESKIAKMNSDHHQFIQELNNRNQKELEEIQKDYETSMNHVDEWAQNKTDIKLQPVENEINKIKRQIELVKSQHEEEPEDDALYYLETGQQLELEKIHNLESELRDKNKDRLAQLLNAKNQLSQCVSTLEELERAHTTNMDKLRTSLEIIDNKYENKLKSIESNHEKKTKQLKEKLGELEAQNTKFQSSIKKTQAEYTQQMFDASKTNDQMKLALHATTASKSSFSQSQNQVTETQNISVQLDNLRSHLSSRENVLIDERNCNEALKREIGRLRDESRIASRRSKLNII